MPLEKDIYQTKSFPNPHVKAMVNLLYTYRWLSELLRNYFNNFGITNKQYNVLRILKGAKKPLSTSEIRIRMIDKMSDTTRIINRMVKKNLVIKTVSESDRRLVDIRISELGLTLLEQIDQHHVQLSDHFNGLTEEEAILLNQLLDKLRDDFDTVND